MGSIDNDDTCNICGCYNNEYVICNECAEDLKGRLSAAIRVINIIAVIVDGGEMYDDEEGDCMYCGAEASPDGYPHVKSCRARQLEEALEIFRRFVPDKGD